MYTNKSKIMSFCDQTIPWEKPVAYNGRKQSNVQVCWRHTKRRGWRLQKSICTGRRSGVTSYFSHIFTYNHKLPLCFITSKMNSKNYTELLDYGLTHGKQCRNRVHFSARQCRHTCVEESERTVPRLRNQFICLARM